jgi:hypothetical protein
MVGISSKFFDEKEWDGDESPPPWVPALAWPIILPVKLGMYIIDKIKGK